MNKDSRSGVATSAVTRGLLALAILILNGPLYAAASRYDYAGVQFTRVQNNNPAAIYDTSMSVNGFFVFADPLAPNTLYNVDGASPAILPPTILDYSFFDGVQTLTLANSIVPFFMIQTNSDTPSLPSIWSFSIHRPPGPNDSHTPGTISAAFSQAITGPFKKAQVLWIRQAPAAPQSVRVSVL